MSIVDPKNSQNLSSSHAFKMNGTVDPKNPQNLSSSHAFKMNLFIDTLNDMLWRYNAALWFCFFCVLLYNYIRRQNLKTKEICQWRYGHADGVIFAYQEWGLPESDVLVLPRNVPHAMHRRID